VRWPTLSAHTTHSHRTPRDRLRARIPRDQPQIEEPAQTLTAGHRIPRARRRKDRRRRPKADSTQPKKHRCLPAGGVGVRRPNAVSAYHRQSQDPTRPLAGSYPKRSTSDQRTSPNADRRPPNPPRPQAPTTTVPHHQPSVIDRSHQESSTPAATVPQEPERERPLTPLWRTERILQHGPRVQEASASASC
jgi:hypothetical protein